MTDAKEAMQKRSYSMADAVTIGREQTILFAMDASDQAEQAVEWYIEHLHRPGNRLVFIHCIELPEMKSGQARKYPSEEARNMHMSPGVLASMWKDEEAKTKELEDQLKAKLKEKGLTGMLRTASGKPGEVICRVAEEEQADMIICGTRGVGKIRRTIMGSVSDYVVHHAHCPVIVCRHPKFRQRRLSSTGSSRSRHSSGEKSRHASGDKLRHASGSDKTRHMSGDSSRSRHQSGEKLGLASRLMRHFSLGSDPDEKKEDKENEKPKEEPAQKPAQSSQESESDDVFK